MAQSSNDTFPSAMYIAAAHQREAPAQRRGPAPPSPPSRAWDIVKISRTHAGRHPCARTGMVGYVGCSRSISSASTTLWCLSPRPGRDGVGTGINSSRVQEAVRRRCTPHRPALRQRAQQVRYRAPMMLVLSGTRTLGVSLYKSATTSLALLRPTGRLRRAPDPGQGESDPGQARR
jgi:fumarate hydratase class II